MFYTRIPCPKNIDHNENSLNQATRYFPLIGWVVGLISFLSFLIASQVFSIEISVIVSLIVGIFVTGAFHEDGFADFFDGFGGGWTKSKILEIMKDSRVGTYGLVSTVFLLALKFYALVELINFINPNNFIPILIIFISYHAIARATAIQLCFFMEYVREDELSKAKPIAKQHGIKEKLGVLVFGLIPFVLLILLNLKFITLIIPLILIVLYFRQYLQKWIGGYTGDCLGAVEQICEVIILLTLLGIWKFTL